MMMTKVIIIEMIAYVIGARSIECQDGNREKCPRQEIHRVSTPPLVHAKSDRLRGKGRQSGDRSNGLSMKAKTRLSIRGSLFIKSRFVCFLL